MKHSLIILCLMLLTTPALRAEIGKDAPSAPTALVDVSEEAFADALGLSEKVPDPMVALKPPPATGPTAQPAPNSTLLDKITGPEPKILGPKVPARPQEPSLDFAQGPTQGVMSPLEASPQMMMAPPKGYAPAYVPVPVPSGGGGGDCFIVVNNQAPVAPPANTRDVAATENKDSILTPFANADAAKIPSADAPPATTPAAPAAPPAAPAAPAVASAPPNSNVPNKAVAMPAMAGVPDVAIILTADQFHPARVKLKQGSETRLLFTTTNSKPAALIIEKLDIQKWVSSPDKKQFATELERAQYELNRELAINRVTEVILTPKPGVYSFHDALSGAAGEIVVE